MQAEISTSQPASKPTTEDQQALQFLKMLGAPTREYDFRTFDDKGRDHKLTRKLNGNLKENISALRELNSKGAGVFVVVNEGGQTAAEITRVRAVFADTDGAALEPLLCLQPHMVIVSSPDKWHVYWLVDHDFPLSAFGQVQSAIAAKFGTDPAVKDLPRVMRLPGFYHNKGEPVLSRIIQGTPDLPRYSMVEIVAGLGLQIGAESKHPKLNVALGNALSPDQNTAPYPFNVANATEFLEAAHAAHPNGIPDRQSFYGLGMALAVLVVAHGWPEPEARKILDDVASKPAGANQSNNDIEWANYLSGTRENISKGEAIIGHKSIFALARANGWKPTREHPAEWVEKMNAEFFVAQFAGTVVIFRKTGDTHTHIKPDAFKLLLANQFVEVPTSNGTKTVSVAEAWLRHPQRRQYRGVGFWPGEETLDGYFNLWGGWPVYPEAGDVEPALEHIREVICDGDYALFKWLLGWCANVIQHPDEQGHVALVVVGGRGTGKTMFAEWMKAMFGRHAMSVANSKLLTGEFTGHLEQIVLLVAEEAFWAGSKEAENSLKHIITGNTLTVHHKGFAPYEAKNHLHIIMTSNEDWVIPAGVDERRFCVCNASNSRKGDFVYFKRLAEWADGGGIAALLSYLLAYDLAGFNVRNPPDTSGLRDQKLMSLDPVSRWILHRLEAGGLVSAEWKQEVSVPRMVAGLCEQQQLNVHEKRRAETSLGTTLHKIFPGMRKTRRRTENGGRESFYRLPVDSVAEARAEFEAYTGLHGYNWGGE